MLRTATKETLRAVKNNSILLWRIQGFSSVNSNVNPKIDELYAKLLKQSPSAPVACNFVSQVLDGWGEKQNKLAIRCVDQDGDEHDEICYADIVGRTHQIANFFVDQGFKKGDTVALMLGQRSAWWYGLAGLMRAGIAAVPCPRLLTPKDLLYRINDLGIRGVITSPELQERVDAIRDECPTLQTTQIGNDIRQGRKEVEDACLYLYTSGTTGQPKAVQHNADYPFFHWPTGRRWLRCTPDDLVYNASDTGWGFTVWITIAAWSMGSKLLITPTKKKFQAEKMLATLRDQSVTIFCAAPTVLRLLVADPAFDRVQLPALRRIATVGEALDEAVIQRFERRGVEVAVGFGQAETPLIMGRVDDQPHIPGTMGRPIDPYRVVALDDDYQPLPPGNVGQIAVDLATGKSGGIMRGYANAVEKFRKTRSPDGRYHLTGDWAFYRPDGQLFAYHGRKDDLIKSRGYRIGPDEVEKAGMSHPAVAKIAVVGVNTEADPHAVTVKAFILLKPGYTENQILIDAIQAQIKRETGPYKYPRLVECLPLKEWEKYETTSGKIRRAGLREREKQKLKVTPTENPLGSNNHQ